MNETENQGRIPYNVGKNYMMGALICGRTDKFMQMSETLKTRIDEDLADRRIALWHDESHFNKYVLEDRNLRVLTPSYGYAEGAKLPFEKKMELLDKRKHFDVSLFKRDELLALHKETPKLTLLFKIKWKLNRIIKNCRINFLYWRDTLLRRHI